MNTARARRFNMHHNDKHEPGRDGNSPMTPEQQNEILRAAGVEQDATVPPQGENPSVKTTGKKPQDAAKETEQEEAAKAEFSKRLNAAVITSPALSSLNVPERPKLLGEFLREADLGFIFAPRGVGKTWIAILIGNALAEGAKLGNWAAGESKRGVLYVDGEMNLPDSKARARAVGITAEGFRWLHHDLVFEKSEIVLNLGSLELQEAIASLLSAGDVLILDNLSALCRGIEENSNDDWEKILPWLLALRRKLVTVIVVHHAGRNGQMRGASRREDAAHWILSLKDDTDDSGGKALVSTFAKCRNCSPKDAMPLRWTLDIRDDSLTYKCTSHSGIDALIALVLSGVDSATNCAEMLGITKGAVSKQAKKAQESGQIRIVGGKYLPPLDAEKNAQDAGS